MPRDFEVVKVAATNNAIAASSHHLTLSFTTSPSQCAEILSVEVVPDIDGAGINSNLAYMDIEIDDARLPHNRYSVNWFRNQLPFADILGRRPAHKFGLEWSKDFLQNTTIKLRADQKFGCRFYADAVGVTRSYQVIATVIFYNTEQALREIYGSQYSIDIPFLEKQLSGQEITKTSNRVVEVLQGTFSELPGGYDQGRPKVYPFNAYAGNKVATTPNEYVEPEPDILSFRVDPKEIFILQGIGVVPHANSKETWVYVDQVPYPKKYPFPTSNIVNTLPWGSHTDFQGPDFFLPGTELVVKGQKFETKIKDNGVAIPINGQYTALLGKYLYL